jgi:hypothetical protein
MATIKLNERKIWFKFFLIFIGDLSSMASFHSKSLKNKQIGNQGLFHAR